MRVNSEETQYEKIFNLGRILFKENKFNQAKSFFEKCLSFKDALDDNFKKIDLFVFLAHTNIQLYLFKFSVDYLNMALELLDNKFVDEKINEKRIKLK